MRLTKRLSALIPVTVLLSGLFTGFSLTASAAPADITAKFTDLNFRAAVYEAIGKKAPEAITDADAAGVSALFVTEEGITSLAGLEYFTGLETLFCGNNQLASLPELPSGLTRLDCSINKLTSLPELPSGLDLLLCQGNLLASLPELPSGLTLLFCQNNLLTSLPPLPSGLKNLCCSSNLLSALDVSGLKSLAHIVCTYNDMTGPSAVKGFTGIWDGLDFCFAPQNTPGPPLTGMSERANAEVSSLYARSNWYGGPLIPLPLQNNFKEPIRRDEFTALLVSVYEYAGNMAMLSETPFTDITGSPYNTAISYAYDIGLVDGTSATAFSPDNLLTREQTAKLLCTIFDLTVGAKPGAGKPDFTDNSKISSWAVPYVAYAQTHKLMQGKSGGAFDPKGNLTREEALLAVERLIVQFGR